MLVSVPSVDNTNNDGRKSNRGSAVCIKTTNEKKAAIIQFFEESGLNATIFVEKYNLALKYKKYLSEGKDGWRH